MAKMRRISPSKQIILATPKEQSQFCEPTPEALPTNRSAADPVSDATSQRVLEWLGEVGLLQVNRMTVDKLPQYFANGVAFINLINILEPRSNTIKLPHSQPKDQSAAAENIKKMLRYLRHQPKMRPKHLWSETEILKGNFDVIFGLLEDMRVFWSEVKRAGTPNLRQPLCASPYRSGKTSRARGYGDNRSRSAKSPFISQNSQMESMFTCTSPMLRNSYTQKGQIKQQQQQKDSVPEFNPTNYQRLRDWLIALGLGHYLDMEGHGLCGDPMRNGVLLSELVQLLENIRISNITVYPKRPSEAQENFKKIVAVLVTRVPEINPKQYIKIDRILRGEQAAIWGFLQILYDHYPHIQAAELLSPGFELPYSVTEIKGLENSLLAWIFKLGILPSPPTSIFHLLPQFKTGVLLADLVNVIFPVRISGIYRDPQTAKARMANIQKCLTILKKSGRMSAKFVGRDREILAGDLASILGLLEDLHRYADGWPARRRGKEYHSDGPYISIVPSRKSQSQPPARPYVAKSTHHSPKSKNPIA